MEQSTWHHFKFVSHKPWAMSHEPCKCQCRCRCRCVVQVRVPQNHHHSLYTQVWFDSMMFWNSHTRKHTTVPTLYANSLFVSATSPPPRWRYHDPLIARLSIGLDFGLTSFDVSINRIGDWPRNSRNDHGYNTFFIFYSVRCTAQNSGSTKVVLGQNAALWYIIWLYLSGHES